ncbi:MAG: hypothetical protein WA005_11155 [Candidatus Binataceae bacterium]
MATKSRMCSVPMYPNFARWQAAKAAVGPNNRFSSSLSRRLAMEP